MYRKSITTNLSPEVHLQIEGDLILMGWEEPEVRLECSSSEDLQLEQRADALHIVCQDNCSMHVPYAASVIVERVDGQAICKTLESDLRINHIAGNLIIKNLATCQIETIDGNLIAKNLAGNLHVGKVNGNVTIRGIQGEFQVGETINGNLQLQKAGASASALVQGNATLRFDPQVGHTYRFEAQGNLVCQLPADCSANVEVTHCNRLLVSLPGVKTSVPPRAPFTCVLGGGGAQISLASNGNLVLSSSTDWGGIGLEQDMGEDFENLAETISEQVEAHVEMIEEQLETHLEQLSDMFGKHGFSPEHAERIAERARLAGERASQRAQEKLMRLQEKLQRKMAAVQPRVISKIRAAELRSHDRRRRPETFPSSDSTPAHQAASEEERLLILQMLADKKISIDEAEGLLNALEQQPE